MGPPRRWLGWNRAPRLSTSPLIVSQDLSYFFRQELGQASASLGVSMQPSLQAYIVHLLCSYSHRHAQPDDMVKEPLAVLLGRANSAPAAEQLALYKSLGDSALYMAGFFIESFERTLIDPDYYVAMGSEAYRQVAGVSHLRRKIELVDMYVQLAERFGVIVDLLNYMAAKSQGRSGRDTDLLKLYERYARTGNERTRRILVDCGWSVQAAAGDEPIH